MADHSVGTVAANLHKGSRSEILADYLFSSWGTVTPVRRQDDFGVDLFCTLTEREGQRAFVREYFTVSTRNLLEAEAKAGVGNHLAVTICGADLLPESGYLRAQLAQR